ncbi:MAG: patatin-like phospholipase family protein [Candidatus Omnitrophica bacterium]|nr:patatin-like phospholipase family protein [Candidatus Omnitrophota bacterium]MCK5492714.1 patatin-like phospholipase family protein [Candidatus Omnitrophota bacterium]
MSYHFKNLVFEGGGVKGIAYVGAMEILKERGILQNIRRVGGTSAGAINATLLALNYSNTETKKILSELNFNDFMDNSWFVLNDFCRVWSKYGWNKGKFFRKWLGDIIESKTKNSKTTFKELYVQKRQKGFKDLFVMGTNLSTHFAEVFSYEKTPDMPIADAVRISMSIPLFFASKKSARGDVYVDGGVLANYPVKLFDREKYIEVNKKTTSYYEAHNEDLLKKGIQLSKYVYNKETLGFRLSSNEEIGIFRDQKEPVSHKIKSFPSFAKSLIGTLMKHQLNTHLHSDDWQRTIYINASIAKTTEFDLSDEKKEALVEAGRNGIKRYFEWYDNNPSENK